MSQEVLPYSFESAGPKRRATAHAGLCPYLELACVCGLLKSIRNNVHVCSGEQGYTAEQIVLAPFISLNLAGGQCVDDLQILESDDGFGRVFRMAELLSTFPMKSAGASTSVFAKGVSVTLLRRPWCFGFWLSFMMPNRRSFARMQQLLFRRRMRLCSA